jgi:hypothetical protein
MEQQTQLTEQQLAAQRAYKTSKESFRKAIKELIADQQQLNTELRRPHTRYMGNEQQRRAVNRVDLRHLYLAYALMRQKYCGYTKLNALWPKMPTQGVWTVNLIEIKGINIDYLIKTIEKHGPKTVYSGT